MVHHVRTCIIMCCSLTPVCKSLPSDLQCPQVMATEPQHHACKGMVDPQHHACKGMVDPQHHGMVDPQHHACKGMVDPQHHACKGMVDPQHHACKGMVDPQHHACKGMVDPQHHGMVDPQHHACKGMVARLIDQISQHRSFAAYVLIWRVCDVSLESAVLQVSLPVNNYVKVFANTVLIMQSNKDSNECPYI